MSINTPNLSEKAILMVTEGLGKENLDALLAADVTDLAIDVLDINGGNEGVAVDLQIGASLTVGELVERIEAAVAANAAAVEQPAPAGLTPAQIAANAKAAQKAQAPKDAGGTGAVVDSTAQSPAPAAPVTPVADLQSEPADVEGTEEADEGLAEPEWITNLGMTGKMFKGTFDRYMVDMRPRMPVDEAAINRNQTTLLRTVLGVINSVEGSEFHSLWNYILQCFAKHSTGVFSEPMVYRGMEHNQMTPEQSRLYPRIVNMLILLADPATRAVALRQINLQKSLAGELVSEAGRRRVFQYFGQ